LDKPYEQKIRMLIKDLRFAQVQIEIISNGGGNLEENDIVIQSTF
jgi:hypothetical protein